MVARFHWRRLLASTFSVNYVRIQRVDGLRTISVYGDIDNSKASSSEIIREFQNKEAAILIEKYPGLRFDFEVGSQGCGRDRSIDG